MQRVVTTFTCRRDAADAARLDAAAADIVADLRTRPAVLPAGAAGELDPRTVDVSIGDAGQGLDAGTVDLVVQIAVTVGGGVASTLVAEATMAWWRGTMLRRLRRRIGDDAIGAESGAAQVTVEAVPGVPAPGAAADVDVRPGAVPHATERRLLP